ncbi:glutamate--tRNA ligase [Ascidiimonas aurantiaca]|uniref:glutamate--tRNA ligase n=1 Tax=Ascidiimonas aurantiaca TaxID=1685432 RepID=UPI0030ED8E73
MNSNIRVRFAPSPTGPLHIGGVRTALFNYLFAKKNNGDFILRIEDTDQNRYVEGAEAYITEALEWCGIPYDEGVGKEKGYGPYRQSERKELYASYADTLLTSGHAYIAFDTAQELDVLRKEYEAKGETFIYNWSTRLQLQNSLTLSETEVKERIAAGQPHVIRFKIVENETLPMQDLVRGTININTSTLDDKVLFKSDGMPTYHLANVVDDHLMEISHVIRGEEWLPSLPLHVLLYKAFNWSTPKFAHLPLILKPNGKGKLSKRDGDKSGYPVFPLEWTDPKTQSVSRGFREDGYFADALINFLALLGWNPGTDQEIFSIDELIKAFDIQKVNKSAASFNIDKLRSFNHAYLLKKSNDSLAAMFSEILARKGITSSPDKIKKAVGLLKERATFVEDLWESGHFLFQAPHTYDETSVKKAWKEGSSTLMKEVIQILQSLTDHSPSHVSSQVKKWIASKEIGFGKVMMPLRLSLVGALSGPDVFEIIDIIGTEEAVLRIQKAIQELD